MARVRYFADIDGVTYRAETVDYAPEGTRMWVAELKVWVKVSRKVEYKSSPSRHQCDDRCLNATGRVMRCECACGGKNHGKGTN